MTMTISIEGVAAPLFRPNIDTDKIIPSHRIQSVYKDGLGESLFGGWRYQAKSQELEPAFILNQEPFQKSKILITGANFGCGSSRESAVWALQEFGFECVIAPSFGSIFYRNCIYNGLLPAILDEALLLDLLHDIELSPCLQIDLTLKLIKSSQAQEYPFEINDFFKQMLLKKQTIYDVSFQFEQDISKFEKDNGIK